MEARERLLDDAPRGHVRSIVPITNRLGTHDRREYEREENAAGMHKGLRKGLAGKSLLV